MAVVLIPLPERDFDPTEVAVSWQVLVAQGHEVRFATPDGSPGRADDVMVTGRGLDPWGFVPGLSRLVGIGRVLRADGHGRAAHAELVRAPSFVKPMVWAEVTVDDFDGLLLPGGHRARGMCQYLESSLLQEVVVKTVAAGKPVAAICHGVLLAARSIDPATGRSVLYGRQTTALTWALEHRAWRVARFSDSGTRTTTAPTTRRRASPRATCRYNRRSRGRSPTGATSTTWSPVRSTPA